MLNRPISEIMTKSVCCVHMNERVDKAVHLFLKNNISILPVINTTGCCVGVLTFKDLVISQGAEFDLPPSTTEKSNDATDSIADISVDCIMSENFVATNQRQSVKEAVATILEKSVHHVVVLDDCECLVGVLSAIDVLRCINLTTIPNLLHESNRGKEYVS